MTQVASRPAGRRPFAILLAAVAAVVLALAPAAAASAHDYLVAGSPAPDSTVTTSISSVRLTFDDVVLNYSRGSTFLQVTGPGSSSRHYETTCAHIDDKNVSAGVALGRSGRYTETWRVVSADGHPVSASIAFTYRAPSGSTPSAGTRSGPSCGIRALSADEYGAPQQGVSPTLLIVLVIGAVVVLAAIAIVVVVLIRLARRPIDGEGDEQSPASP